MLTGIGEFDRVSGGGFVPGLGAAARRRTRHRQIDPAHSGLRRARQQGRRVIYISGEEAVDQVRLRAERLGLGEGPVELAAETKRRGYRRDASSRRPAALARHRLDPDHVDESSNSTPGTVTQVRGAAQALIRFAKTSGAAVILVGHVTKDGQIAGPRVVEHMVDAVHLLRGRRRRAIFASCARQEPLRRHSTRSASSR